MSAVMRGVVKWSIRALGLAALVALILYMSGVLSSGRIAPGTKPAPPAVSEPVSTTVAKVATVPVWYEAVGTVRSRVEARVAPQVTGRVVTVRVEEGSEVAEGSVLATLENEEFKARLEQARSGVSAAEATREKARLDHARMKRLFDQNAATRDQLEAAESLKKQAEAAARAAEQKLEEARVALGYTEIRSPLSGIVAGREVDPGDLGWPGKTLFVVHDPGDLRLEASVREGLIAGVTPGREVEVFLAALEKTVRGTVEEIVPSGDPVSRSFLVKVGLPDVEVLYPGMFGKLRLETGQRRAVTVPAGTITRVGQLRTVVVRQGDRWVRRYVTVGETRGGVTEVLSGLSGGETIALDGDGESGES